MITKYKIFEKEEINKLKGKFVSVDYKIFHQDWKEKPLLLITDYKIHNLEDNYIEVIGKGYEYVNLANNGIPVEYKNKNKKGWLPFDDFEKSNVYKRVPVKAIKDGSKRIKVIQPNDN